MLGSSLCRLYHKKHKVYALHLVCRNTIDEKLQSVIQSKMKMIESVLGERIKGKKAKDTVYKASSEVRDIFDALVQDAREEL